LTRIGDLLPLCFAGGIESPSSRRLAFTSYEFDTGQLAMGRRLNTASADEHQRLHLAGEQEADVFLRDTSPNLCSFLLLDTGNQF
jgi:hypothetical protein